MVVEESTSSRLEGADLAHCASSTLARGASFEARDVDDTEETVDSACEGLSLLVELALFAESHKISLEFAVAGFRQPIS